jgi:hypothetical protein
MKKGLKSLLFAKGLLHSRHLACVVSERIQKDARHHSKERGWRAIPSNGLLGSKSC